VTEKSKKVLDEEKSIMSIDAPDIYFVQKKRDWKGGGGLKRV
jgi:hypothetical protein